MPAVIKVTVDVLNDEPFLEAMQRALDLLEAVERTLEAIRTGKAAPLEALEAQNANFRAWFRPDEDDSET